jgi:hypothetical protein
VRIVHQIGSECDVLVSKDGSIVTVRIVEKEGDTDITIEGIPRHILDAFITTAGVLSNLTAMDKQPN